MKILLNGVAFKVVSKGNVPKAANKLRVEFVLAINNIVAKEENFKARLIV